MTVSDQTYHSLSYLINKVVIQELGPDLIQIISNTAIYQRTAQLQYKEHKNIHTVKLTTAIAISDSVRQAIIEQVKKASGFGNIELDEKVDEDIIGGFVLQVGDKLVEASIAYDLKTIARQFDNNDFIYKIR